MGRVSPTRQALLAPSVKRREVFGEAHKGWALGAGTHLLLALVIGPLTTHLLSRLSTVPILPLIVETLPTFERLLRFILIPLRLEI